jgi:hypothetical protein
MTKQLEALIAKIKKQTESFDTVVLKEEEANALIAALGELLALREAGKEPVGFRWRYLASPDYAQAWTLVAHRTVPDEFESRQVVQYLYAAPRLPAVPEGWSESASVNAITVMLDRIETIDTADDDRIEEVKRLVRHLASPAAPDLSDAQVLEFLTVAFRHNRMVGDIEFDDIRLGLKMAMAAAPKPE